MFPVFNFVSQVGIIILQVRIIASLLEKLGGKKIYTCIYAPPLPSDHRGWNAGKGDCGHYCSHLGFSVLMGRGFIKVGGWTREEPEEPLSHFFFQKPCGEFI